MENNYLRLDNDWLMRFTQKNKLKNVIFELGINKNGF